MRPAPPYLRNLVQRLIAEEIGQAGAPAPAAFLVCARLRPHLATLMGSTGFRVLLTRALAMVQAKNLWLRTLQVDDDGLLADLSEAAGLAGAAAIADGSVTLIAQLLTLLVAFIGEALTLQLIRDVWPSLPLEAFHSEEPS